MDLSSPVLLLGPESIIVEYLNSAKNRTFFCLGKRFAFLQMLNWLQLKAEALILASNFHHDRKSRSFSV